MGYQNEPPLTQRELKILRGMMDDHEYRRMHDRESREFWTTTKVVITTFVAVGVFLMQMVTTTVLLLRG